METASTLFLGTTVTAYGVSTWLYRRSLALPSERAAAWARHALMIGVLVHAGSAFLAYTLFTLAALFALLALLQERRLRRSGPSRLLVSLPPLSVAQATAHRCVALGYPLITLTLCSGAVWAEQVWGTPWSWDPKQTMALLTWLLYTVYLRVRSAPRWAGRWSAWLLVGGLGCVLLTFLGVNLAGLTAHDFSGR